MAFIESFWAATLASPIYILSFVAVLSVVVFIHEMGHFLVGRWCGVAIDAFSLGMGPELAHIVDRKGTRWRLAAFPIGGYVKFHGDMNGASMPDPKAIDAMPAAEHALTFAAQPVWKRAAIVAAGPVANFLLAIVIFSGLFMIYGKRMQLPRVQRVIEQSAAAEAGLKAGDLIVSIDGQPIETFIDMQRVVQRSSGLPLQIIVRRPEGEAQVTATPRTGEIPSVAGKQRVGVLGVEASSDPADVRTERFGPIASVKLAVGETWSIVAQTGSYIGGIFVGRESADQMTGALGIAKISGEMAKIGVSAVVNLIAFLSVSIGLMNLLPVPLLDGGHLLYYGVEALQGRPMSQRVQEAGFRIGIAFVAALMLFATFNDLKHLVRG